MSPKAAAAPVVVYESQEQTTYRLDSAAGYTTWSEAKPGSTVEAQRIKQEELAEIRAKCAEGKATLAEVQRLLV